MELSDLVNLAKECKGSGAWNSATLIRVGGLLAGKINSIQNMSGPEKLKLTQRVLLQALAEVENKEIAEPNLSKEAIQQIHDRYDVLESVVADVLPASLELAINAARGRLDLKKIKPSVWVKLCSCFATTVVHELASLHLISEAHASQARRLLVVVEEKAAAAAEAREGETKVVLKDSVKSESVEEKKETETVPAALVEADTSQ